MAKFVLMPCRIQANYIVPASQEQPPIEVDWKGLVELLAPSKTRQSYRTLRQMRTGGFVGISRLPNSTIPMNWVLINQDRSGSIGMVLKKQPDFTKQLLKVYRVEFMQWDDRMVDLGTSHGVPVAQPAA